MKNLQGRQTVVLLLLSLMLTIGCEREDVPPAPVPARTDIPLATQIAQVQAGQSIEIRVTEKLSRGQLPAILSLENLVRLNLSETDLTDEDVKQIAALPRLETLRLSSPHLTDTSLAHLATSKTLRHLILFDTPITDAGLRHLVRIQTLESLYLTNTAVTDAGLSTLIEQRPTLHVH